MDPTSKTTHASHLEVFAHSRTTAGILVGNVRAIGVGGAIVVVASAWGRTGHEHGVAEEGATASEPVRGLGA